MWFVAQRGANQRSTEAKIEAARGGQPAHCEPASLCGASNGSLQHLSSAGDFQPMLQLVELGSSFSVADESRDHIRQLVSGLSVLLEILSIKA
jgi:hypothetical protein